MITALERLLLPNVCVACERAVESSAPDGLFCSVCSSRFEYVSGGCDRCSQPLPPVGPCRFCADWPAVLENVRSAVWLTSEARAVVHHFKYDDYPGLAVVVARVMRKALPPVSGVLIPIPLSARKLRLRGYNQSRLIARELGRGWRIPVEDAVTRLRETGTQTALTPEARLANVATVFTAAPSEGFTDAILVDDVFTTGATLRAAATALQEAGWRRVRGVTFARALTYERRALADTGS